MLIGNNRNWVAQCEPVWRLKMRILAKPTVASGSNALVTLLETEPSAARIAHAIAAFPYDYLTATMDIVDNSVESGARGVSVEFEVKSKAIERIVFADNGAGISRDIVNEVLRAGSRTNHLYGSTSLSRFGVGLKGAGFALAAKITFFTRNGSGEVVRRSIDQEQIEATDRWQQEAREPTAAECTFFEETLRALPGSEGIVTGTVVILEKVKLKSRDLSKLRTDLVRRAGQTYSKFLATSGDIRRLAINIDKLAVEPFDPLHRDDPGTQHIYKREKIDFEDGSTAFFTSVSLPHPNTLPPETVRRYRYTQTNQGAYVYRNGRLIRSSETFGLFNRDFHLNAFRAELEYDSSAESHFNVDVAKSTIVLDDEAEAKLRPLFRDSARTADTLWRQKDVPTKVEIEDLFNESNRLIGSRANLLIEAINQKPGELRIRKPKPKIRPAPSVSAPHASPSTSTDPSPGGADVSAPGDAPLAPTSVPPSKTKSKLGGYLRPVEQLPDGVLYRPLMDADVGLVVEVNISHPFAKAVFEASGESTSAGTKRTVPRLASTAIQQLLYVLGFCEFTMSDDENGDTARLFDQYRRYLSMNVTALLD
jgi:hypothetical protein